MAVVITRLRRPLLGRIKARVRCAYVRWLIRHAEKDLASHRAEFARASKQLPAQIKLDLQHIDNLTRQLQRALYDV